MQEVLHHLADQHDERFGRWLELQQLMHRRIGLAFFRENLGIKCRFGRKVLEQQTLGNGGCRRDTLGCGARKSMAAKQRLAAARINCRRKSPVMRRVLMVVSKHSPYQMSIILLRCTRNYSA